jgi:NADH:ubiquinone oxidoreductase subunit
MSLMSDIFTWWNGTTLSTRLYTKRRGRLVGEDANGNKYFEDKKAKMPAGRLRRWVIYSGLAEASRVPADWHGWLHYINDEPPGTDYKPKAWQKPHAENGTGSADAYRPAGSILAPHRRRVASSDYEPWQAE